MVLDEAFTSIGGGLLYIIIFNKYNFKEFHLCPFSRAQLKRARSQPGGEEIYLEMKSFNHMLSCIIIIIIIIIVYYYY